MEEEKDECKIGLGLGIGGGHVVNSYRPPLQFHILFPPHPPPTNSKQEEDADCTKNSKRLRSVEEVKESVVQEMGGSKTRKKLRLSKEQTTVLEDTFRDHNTLTGIQKQDLAEKLNLSPRQVEVWFQNRRARSKLKQTEVDFQLLEKWCDSLNEENRRLRKELQELKLIKQPESSTKVTSVASTALIVCPSCGRTAAGGDSSMAC